MGHMEEGGKASEVRVGWGEVKMGWGKAAMHMREHLCGCPTAEQAAN